MKNKFLKRYQTEIPLKEDNANFFLEISIAVFVFLFSIVLAMYFITDAVLDSWNKNIVDGLTVQIMPSSEALSKEDELLRTNRVVSFFNELPNVEKVVLVSETQIKSLLSPWLGENSDIDSLPIPRLLDVHLKNGKNFNYDKVSEELEQQVPYASIDNHGIWLKKLTKSAFALKLLSVFMLSIVSVVLAFSLFYAVQTSLKVHQNIIEILHIMGATDNYVAKQYASRGFWIGLLSGGIGMIASILALLVMAHLSSGLETGLIGSARLSMWHWCVLVMLPVFSALLSMFMSFISVKHTLGKIM